MKVYSVPFSTNCERVALAAAYKGVAVEWHEVPYDNRTEVIDVSGQDLVPVLVDDGLVLHDSPVILRWLEEQHPDPPLWPASRARRAEVDVFVDWFNRLWKRPPNLIAAELERDEPDLAAVNRWSAQMAAALDRFESLLAGRAYLCDEFGVADCIAFPFLKYAVLGTPPGDDELFHRILVDHQPLGSGYPRLRAWVARVDERPRA